ncbi:MAG: septum formation family protein [Terrimesophilobacter sp.]
MATLAISLSGCSAFGPEKPSVFSLKVGDCFNDPSAKSDDVVSEVEIVKCKSAHDNEIFHHALMTGSTYPGTDGAYAQAEEACAPTFFDFIGFSGDPAGYEYELEYSYFVPTQDSWDNANDRAIDCFAYNADASQLTDTLEGAAK